MATALKPHITIQLKQVDCLWLPCLKRKKKSKKLYEVNRQIAEFRPPTLIAAQIIAHSRHRHQQGSKGGCPVRNVVIGDGKIHANLLFNTAKIETFAKRKHNEMENSFATSKSKGKKIQRYFCRIHFLRNFVASKLRKK
ncbi:MAG: hypothetical protein J6I60_00130 [Bacteroidaceae bacterium]|nr:hypothetical protein [Bacteroidaceae bacterium]